MMPGYKSIFHTFILNRCLKSGKKLHKGWFTFRVFCARKFVVHNNLTVKYLLLCYIILLNFHKAFFICTDFKLKLLTLCKLRLNLRRSKKSDDYSHNTQTFQSSLNRRDVKFSRRWISQLVTPVFSIVFRCWRLFLFVSQKSHSLSLMKAFSHLCAISEQHEAFWLVPCQSAGGVAVRRESLSDWL